MGKRGKAKPEDIIDFTIQMDFSNTTELIACA